MVKAKHAVATRRRKKRVLKATKGQFGHRKSRYIQAKRSLLKGLQYSYRDRKVYKREIRNLWVTRINAACRLAGITYSRFIKGLIDSKIEVNRKVLSELILTAPDAFNKLVEIAKEVKEAKEAKAVKTVKKARVVKAA